MKQLLSFVGSIPISLVATENWEGPKIQDKTASKEDSAS